jgi:hypothetical protein
MSPRFYIAQWIWSREIEVAKQGACMLTEPKAWHEGDWSSSPRKRQEGAQPGSLRAIINPMISQYWMRRSLVPHLTLAQPLTKSPRSNGFNLHGYTIPHACLLDASVENVSSEGSSMFGIATTDLSPTIPLSPD